MAEVRRGTKRKGSCGSKVVKKRKTALNTIAPFSFKHPSSILICRPSGSGKTVFTADLLLRNKQLWPDTPNVVHYCYGVWQDSFRPMQWAGIKFHQGIPEPKLFSKWFPKGGMLVLDDLIKEGGNDKTVVDLFTKFSHHKGITVIYLTQDLFPPGKYAKTISRNAHYIVAFKNPRDQVGMRNLLLQAYPNRWKEVQEVFNKTTDCLFGYIVLDFHPASSDACRILSHILKREGHTHCYA